MKLLSVLSAVGWLVIALVVAGWLAQGDWGPVQWVVVALIPLAALWFVIYTAVRAARR